MRHFSLALIAITICLFQPAEAKRFRNSYISFELPTGWKCRPQGVAWICNHFDKLIKQEAQIVIAAKEAGPSDNLQVFTQYLKQPRSIEGFKKGSVKKTRPIHTKQKLIGNKTWVDSLHLSGESEAYYTRYIGTVHKDLSIMATFTIHRNAYPYHSASIIKAIDSLAVVFNKPIVNQRGSGLAGNKSRGIIGSPIGMGPGSQLSMGEDIKTEASKSGSSKTNQLLGILLLIAAIGAYVYIKRKK